MKLTFDDKMYITMPILHLLVKMIKSFFKPQGLTIEKHLLNPQPGLFQLQGNANKFMQFIFKTIIQ